MSRYILFHGSGASTPCMRQLLDVFERHEPDFDTVSIYIMKSDGSGLTSVLTLPRSRVTSDAATTRRLKKLESGGSIPRWGVAAE